MKRFGYKNAFLLPFKSNKSPTRKIVQVDCKFTLRENKLMKFWTLVILLIIPFGSVSADLLSVSFGPVKFGEPRIPIELKNFTVKVKKQNGVKIKTGLIKKSVQWIRSENNLLIPRARIGIILKDNAGLYHLRYQDQSFIPEERKDYFYSELYIHLFTPKKINVYKDEKLVAQISVHTEIRVPKSKTRQIDYSCLKYRLQLIGLDNEYVSVGCHLEKKGSWGNETPRLEVTWTTTNYTLMDDTPPPFVTVFNGNYTSKINLKNQDGEKKEIEIKVKLPNRLHRLKTAYGFGPYFFNSTLLAKTDLSQAERTEKEPFAPALFLYGKLDLSTNTSLRIFDALVFKKVPFKDKTFNNFGFYFAYDLARAFDGKVQIVPLLGIQGLTFKFDKNDDAFTRIIYPQGFELVFNHFLGMENYTVVYGMFLSTESDIDYQNIWVRWGRGPFWELNYIGWSDGVREAKMGGLSIGLPLASFF